MCRRKGLLLQALTIRKIPYQGPGVVVCSSIYAPNCEINSLLRTKNSSFLDTDIEGTLMKTTMARYVFVSRFKPFSSKNYLLPQLDRVRILRRALTKVSIIFMFINLPLLTWLLGGDRKAATNWVVAFKYECRAVFRNAREYDGYGGLGETLI